jgi:hypothetical protein
MGALEVSDWSRNERITSSARVAGKKKELQPEY